MIKEKLTDLFERTFKENDLFLLVMIEMLYSHLKSIKEYTLWSCQKVHEALIFLLDNIYIRFGTKLYRQNVGIPIGTNVLFLTSDSEFSGILYSLFKGRQTIFLTI